MSHKKNGIVKRQNSMHSQINCKSKLELKMSDNNNNPIFKHKESFDLNHPSMVNNKISSYQKSNSHNLNKKKLLKPIIKGSIEEIKDPILNSPTQLVKGQKRPSKFGTKSSNKFRYNAKIKQKTDIKKFKINCAEKAVKPQSTSRKDLKIKIDFNEVNNSEYTNTDNKIEIVYKSSDRSIYNYSSATQKGIFFIKNIEKEHNQDVSLIIEDVCGIKNYNIYCIMDGHGSNGHYVSNYIKEKIIENFNNISFYFHKIEKITKIEEYPEDILDLIKKKLKKNDFQKIKEFYKLINEGLSANEIHFDTNFSGSTCTILFQIGNYLICSNVGDSRAIMIKENNEIIELSKDQKPEDPEEKKRIENMGGIVSQCNDLYDDGKEGGPFRIWLKGCDYPGIAMSRSIGDQIAHSIGVSSEPEIFNFDINEKCECLVIGSDGIFQYLKNEDVANIIRPFISKKEAENGCKEIIRKASLNWMDNDNNIDDITVSIIFLKN